MKNNTIYLYNDTFVSLLSLIKILLKEHIVPQNIKGSYYQPSLLEETILLKISDDEKVLEEIIKVVGNNIFNTIYYVFCSNDLNKEIIIYCFLVQSLKYKNKIFYMRNLNGVASALRISQYVSRENHKMKGFLRFKELSNNILYAEMSPENDILFLLSRHFQARLRNEYWIIKDVKRNILSIYDKKNFYLVSADNFTLITSELSNEEKDTESLWKSFYKTIGIKERKNERCQRNFMPKKYWKYIIEVSEENEESSK